MGATEEQLQLVSDAHITHVSYILVLYSFAFLIFLFTNMLLHLYAVNAVPAVPPKDVERPPRIPRINGHRPSDSRQIRDAGEFELEGLLSEDDGPSSPSTLGKNGDARVD